MDDKLLIAELIKKNKQQDLKIKVLEERIEHLRIQLLLTRGNLCQR